MLLQNYSFSTTYLLQPFWSQNSNKTHFLSYIFHTLFSRLVGSNLATSRARSFRQGTTLLSWWRTTTTPPTRCSSSSRRRQRSVSRPSARIARGCRCGAVSKNGVKPRRNAVLGLCQSFLATKIESISFPPSSDTLGGEHHPGHHRSPVGDDAFGQAVPG